MYCSNCGNLVPDDTDICPSCGNMQINPKRYRVNKGIVITCVIMSLIALFLESIYYYLLIGQVQGLGMIGFLRQYFASAPEKMIIVILAFLSLIALVPGSALLRAKPIVFTIASVLYSGIRMVSWTLTNMEIRELYGSRYWQERAIIISIALILVFVIAYAFLFTAMLVKDEKRRIFAVISAGLFFICIIKDTLSAYTQLGLSFSQGRIGALESMSSVMSECMFVVVAIGLILIPGKPESLKKY